VSYYKSSNINKTMLKVIEPIIFAFLRGKALKKLALDIVRAMVTKSDNSVDDRLCDALEKALFPGR
jgi:hypothetical protein|tara:strand:+ start:518 stop:715 length:198 start_codon:yes stop_codon:yes gene_type:complete